MARNTPLYCVDIHHVDDRMALDIRMVSRNHTQCYNIAAAYAMNPETYYTPTCRACFQDATSRPSPSVGQLGKRPVGPHVIRCQPRFGALSSVDALCELGVSYTFKMDTVYPQSVANASDVDEAFCNVYNDGSAEVAHMKPQILSAPHSPIAVVSLFNPADRRCHCQDLQCSGFVPERIVVDAGHTLRPGV